jgi:hypothetical protein
MVEQVLIPDKVELLVGMYQMQIVVLPLMGGVAQKIL